VNYNQISISSYQELSNMVCCIQKEKCGLEGECHRFRFLIEFVCVEAGRGAGEPRGSWPTEQTSLYHILDCIFCFFANVC
jgi:hypothetical protein